MSARHCLAQLGAVHFTPTIKRLARCHYLPTMCIACHGMLQATTKQHASECYTESLHPYIIHMVNVVRTDFNTWRAVPDEKSLILKKNPPGTTVTPSTNPISSHKIAQMMQGWGKSWGSRGSRSKIP